MSLTGSGVRNNKYFAQIQTYLEADMAFASDFSYFIQCLWSLAFSKRSKDTCAGEPL